jgi:hypothetical protein
MIDHRQLYINQLLSHYKVSAFDEKTTYSCTVKYKLPNNDSDIVLMFSHNAGLEVIAQYIKDLESKLDELQYVERIIKIAKENNK